MSEPIPTYTTDGLADIADRDQDNAVLHDISRAVARHYTTLVEAGMPPLGAITLCKHFQDALMVDGTVTVNVGMEGE